MPIDKRLVKLAERHEALTQNIEMLASDVRELTESTHEHAAQVLHMIAQLVQVAKGHEQRLTDLEPSPGS